MDRSSNALGFSRRSFLKLVIAAGGTAAAVSFPSRAYAEEAEASDYPEKFTFAVMSDIHLFAPELYSDCPDYTTAENSDRKMFRESADILEKALTDVVVAKPNMVIVPGDLTKDGELVCHEYVAQKFAAAKQQLADAGVDTQFYVINGNHDLNNHHGKDFSSGSAVDAERTDPITYKNEIWHDCGYTDTVVFDEGGTADGSLSYVAHPCPGLTLIAVDTCKYNVDAGDGTLAQETSGHISDELLAWVCDQAKQARAAGDVVIAMQHHGIVPHFDYEPTIFGEYLVDDYGRVAQAYAEAGISAVFTGHMHANDIAAATYGDATIYDIETGSLVTYPSRMRMGSLAFAQDGDNLTCTLTVDSHSLGTVAMDECGLSGSSDIEAYGKERTLTVDSLQTMIGGMLVQPVIAEAAQNGIRQTICDLAGSLGLSGLTPDTMNATLWTLITGILPQSKEEGITIDLSSVSIAAAFGFEGISIFYNAGTNAIEAWEVPNAPANPDAVMRSVPPELVAQLAQTPAVLMFDESQAVIAISQNTFDAILNETFDNIDNGTLSEEGQENLLTLVAAVIENLLTAKVDETNTLLGLVDYCYQDHLMGCETCDSWVETAISNVRENDLLGQIIGDCVNTVLANATTSGTIENTVAKSIKFASENTYTTMITGHGLSSVIVGFLLAPMLVDLSTLADALVNTFGITDLGSIVAGIIPGTVTDLAAGALDTLAHDTNVAEDHDFSLDATAALPAGGDDGDHVDKSSLQAAIDQAGKIDTTGASQAAIDAFNDALARARSVMSNPDATEETVAQAQADLEAAIKALEDSKNPGGQGGAGSSQGGTGDQGGTGSQGGTGDQGGTGSQGGSGTGTGTGSGTGSGAGSASGQKPAAGSNGSKANSKGGLPVTGDASAVAAAAVALGGAAALGVGAGLHHRASRNDA